MTNNEKNYCVYIHRNKINQKAYVGITGITPEIRWGKNGQGYLRKKPNGEYGQPLMAHAIIKYGWDNFDHIIFDENLTKEEADHIECLLISLFDLRNPQYGYNIREGGSRGSFSDESKQKISQARIGKALSVEHRRNISKSIKNRTLSEEHRKHIGNSLRGRLFAKEHCEKLSKNHANVSGNKNPNFGNKWTEEDRKNASIPVVQIDKNNDCVINYFYGLSEASMQTGIHISCICECCNGNQKTAGGYLWKYIYDRQLKGDKTIPGAITLGIISEEEILNDYKGENIMADKIIRKYNVSASGVLSIDEDGRLYVSCEDGAQDVSIAKLLEDFDGRQVKISCNYDEEYSEDEVQVDPETGEII